MSDLSRLQSILALKCPVCHEGNLFDKRGWFVYSKILDMPEKCPHCGQNYHIEPGFWLGALWTSYPLVVLIELPFLIGAVASDTIPIYWFFLAMVLSFGIFFPFMLRLGRSIWIHLNIR